MPTKTAVGTADINFVQLGIPERLNRDGIREAIAAWEKRLRYGGLPRRQRWIKLFHPAVTDYSTMPIGLFERKVIILPRCYLPRSKEALRSLCRQLADRGENEQYIEIVLRGWRDGWTLEQHVDLLWDLRARHRRFFEEVVRGRHWRALARLDEVVAAGTLSWEGGCDLICRQALLWCAMDAQLVTCRARVSMTMPFGRLMLMSMKVLKAGTVLRLIHQGYAALEVVCGQYRTTEEEAKGTASRRMKPKGHLTKGLFLFVKETWLERVRTLQEDRTELDNGMNYVRSEFPEMKARLSFYEHHRVENARARGAPPKDHRLLSFHAIWYDGLSPAAGMAVVMTRLAIAERELGEMVTLAASEAREGRSGELLPVPPLPADPKTRAEIQERVLDLCHAARIVHLRDEDCFSRTPEKRHVLKMRRDMLKQLLASRPCVFDRDPLDKAGLTFIREAFAFLDEMGQRPCDANVQGPGRDPRLFTYWKMDCVPEVRLTL